MLSSDVTFSMEMFPFEHCPEGNGDVSSVYGCHKGGSGNSGGRRLAIFMVEEAWLSEKRKNVSSKRKNVSSKRENVFIEKKECIVEEKECCRRREKDVFVEEKRRAF
ncbi:hypothetical protein Tco_1566196 [Tanacetum coccineum]